MLYTSLRADTARAEVERGLRARGIEPSSFSADSYWGYELSLSADKVLDLTRDSVLAKLGVAREALSGDEVSQTRQLAREARTQGYQALLAPSAAAEGPNLVIFLPLLPHPIQVENSAPIALGG